LVEHKMSMVMQISDRITVLDFGQAIAEGAPDEVRENPLVIEAYLGRPPSPSDD
jgi:ABC-type branched-subunit amino acid transport system ATPase component